MSHFHYHKNELHIEKVPLSKIAEHFGTPCYVYSRAALENNWQAFDDAFGETPHRICYAVKANSTLAVLNIFAQKNSGFDIVSRGELERVIAAGGDPNNTVFSGVGKQINEIEFALNKEIACFNVESIPELERIRDIAKRLGKIARIALRINPNIDARTHPYIATGLYENKFGIDVQEILSLIKKIKKMPNIHLIGIACHIGSQLTELDPFLEAAKHLIDLTNQVNAEDIQLKQINIGGGLGVCYQHENPPAITEYAAALKEQLAHSALEIILEPGRAIVANAGILLTRIEYLKRSSHKNFAIVDAGMNDLIRPALYDAWHDIIPIKLRPDLPEETYDVVGPVCESADFLGKNRKLALEQNTLLAVCSAGAYGFGMSSNYNSRPRAAEVMIEGNKIHLIRQRESVNDLFSNEFLI
jgi:diaminopimelate decarboxylase